MWHYGYYSGLDRFLDYLDERAEKRREEYWRKLREDNTKTGVEEHWLLVGDRLVKVRFTAVVERSSVARYWLYCQLVVVDDHALTEDEQKRSSFSDYSCNEPMSPERGKNLLTRSLGSFDIKGDKIIVVSEEFAKRKQRLCKLNNLVEQS